MYAAKYLSTRRAKEEPTDIIIPNLEEPEECQDNKSLHCVMRGNPPMIDTDDILINKPNAQEIELYFPAGQQEPAL